jgi:heme-degrading monooxygenase HmoA
VIRRVVLVKLDPDYTAQRATVAAHTQQVLAGVPGVRALEVGVPADDRTRREWDLGIVVVFDDLEAVEAYREHPVHRKYVDVYLRPMMAKIRALNFETVDAS